MAITPTSNPPPGGARPADRDAVKEQFNQCLRSVDALIKERKFDIAKERLAEAKKLDPSNPYLVAFEERINLFEKQQAQGKTFTHHTTAEKSKATTGMAAQVLKPDAHIPATRESIEEKLRETIEEEYKEKFTSEIHKAEKTAGDALEEERKSLERQRQTLQSQYQQQIAEMQQRLEDEFQKRLEDEIANTEQRLRKQHESEEAFFEQEMKSRLQEHYESKINSLEEQVKKDQAALREIERSTFSEREKKMKEDFNRRLLEGLRKTETVFREQSEQQQVLEKEKLRQKMTEEFEAKLAQEREGLSKRSSEEQEKLKSAFTAEQKRLEEEYRHQLGEQLEQIRKRDLEEFEHKRTSMTQELQKEYRTKYQEQLSGERKRIEEESAAAIEGERKRLQEEYNRKVAQQNEEIQKMRSEMRREMEQKLMQRLQQIVNDYDHRMELLGFKIPQTKDAALKLYQEKMRECYAKGTPTVDGARELMELKELLELTYDDHLAIETDVRLDLYVRAVEKKILTGEFNTQNPKLLEGLKQQFRISAHESSQLEPYILSSFQRIAVKARILVADDEKEICELIEEILTSSGYQVISCKSVPEAIEQLKHSAIDLIVSDIKFLPKEPDGFKFFAMVQEQPKFRKIPFIFLSSLTDGVIIRSGIQLGVDDYLTKPVDPDLLLAVIEGKLKRYRSSEKR